MNLRWSVRHGEAGVGTTLASFGAALAVIHVVRAALCRAAAACLRAQRADFFHVFATSGYRGHGKLADVGTFQIQGDAASHRFGVGLLEAGGGALQTGQCAVVARAQTNFFDLLGHVVSFEGSTLPPIDLNGLQPR